MRECMCAYVRMYLVCMYVCVCVCACVRMCRWVAGSQRRGFAHMPGARCIRGEECNKDRGACAAQHGGQDMEET